MINFIYRIAKDKEMYMKVQSFSPLSFKNSFNDKKDVKKETQYSGYLPSADEFIPQSANVKKETFLNKILNFFNSKLPAQTPQMQKNDEIDFYINQVALSLKDLNKIGKVHFSLAKNSLIIGQEEDYRLYCDLNSKERIKLIFGDMDERTNLPVSMAHIDMKNGMKAIREYEFFDGLNSYMIKDNTVEDIEDEIFLMGKNLVSIKETNLKDNKVQKFVQTREGFYYFEAQLDDKKNIAQVQKIVSSDKKDLLNNQYIEYNEDEGCYDIYAIDEQTGLWDKVGFADNVEAE